MKIPLVKNTVTNYMGMVIRMIQGILVTRWTVQNLGEEQYGLWVALWSFYGYGLLLNFGMGVAGQKATAIELWRKDLDKYNRLIGTITGVNMLMSLLICVATCVGAYHIETLFHLDNCLPSKVMYYRICFLTCGFGAGIFFPAGIFEEMLIGLQKIYLRNYVSFLRNLLELLFVFVVFACGGNVLALLLSSLGTMLLSDILMFWLVWRSIPGFRLGCVIDRELFHEIFNFSGSAYVISIARMIWNRGPLMLLGVLSGLGAISTYQLGCRFPVLMVEVSKPYQENISPLSALLYSRRKMRKLGRILVNSMRWNSFMATGLAIMVFIFSRVLIRGILGVDSEEATMIGRVMAVGYYVWLIARYIPESYLLMAERHVLLAWSYIICSISFVFASVLLTNYSNLVGTTSVMISFIGSLFVSTMFIDLPCMLHDTGVGFWRVMRVTVARPLMVTSPVVALAYLEYCFLLDAVNDILLLAIAGITCGPVYLIVSYMGLLTSDEKQLIKRRLRGLALVREGGMQ